MSEQEVPGPGAPTSSSTLLRPFLISVGVISVALGVIGVFVPLLPTTPFLLVAAACFLRSSDRLYQRLITHPMLGPYIRNYRERRAITRWARIVALVLLWTTIGYATFMLVGSLAVRVALLTIAALVTVHLVRLRTVTDRKPPADDAGES